MKTGENMDQTTKIISADKHCVSCLHWDGVICTMTFRRKKGTEQCPRCKIEYKQHPAFRVKKKNWE